MARRTWSEMSPWRRRSLTIPPDSWSAWVRLAVWELGMGTLLYGALSFGTRLIVTAPDNVVTVFDFTNCYAIPHSHTASLTQALNESGGIVSDRRRQGLISGIVHLGIATAPPRS